MVTGHADRHTGKKKKKKKLRALHFSPETAAHTLKTKYLIYLRKASGPLSYGYQGVVSAGVKWAGCEYDHSPQSSSQVKNAPQVRLTAWC
jgi:hypothetical protein